MTALDPGRTRRALLVNVEALHDDEYRVTGGREPHTVTTSGVPWTCDCRGAAYRHDVRCKHVLITYLAQRLHPSVRVALQHGTETHKETMTHESLNIAIHR